MARTSPNGFLRGLSVASTLCGPCGSDMAWIPRLQMSCLTCFSEGIHLFALRKLRAKGAAIGSSVHMCEVGLFSLLSGESRFFFQEYDRKMLNIEHDALVEVSDQQLEGDAGTTPKTKRCASRVFARRLSDEHRKRVQHNDPKAKAKPTQQKN